MFRTAKTLGGILVLAAAVVVATPSFGQAQPRGGGGGAHGGGAHFTAGHFSGAQVGRARFRAAPVSAARIGGYRGATYQGGTYHSGGYGSGYRYAHNGYGYSHPYSRSYGSYYPYNGLYGSYPYYGTYGNDYDYPYAGFDTTGDPSYTDGTGYYQGGAYSPPVTLQAYPPSSLGTPAEVTVKVPADAQVWFDGVPMTTAGAVRTYESPPLAPGQYSYEVRASWTQDGRVVTQAQQVGVAAGSRVAVDFPAP